MITKKILQAKGLLPLRWRLILKRKFRSRGPLLFEGAFGAQHSFSFSSGFNPNMPPNANYFESDSSDSDKNVFVSRHFNSVTNDMILNLMNKFQLEPKVSSSGQLSAKFCPFCKKPHNFKRDNMYTLQVKPHSGAFFCFRCGAKGSWFDLKNLLYDNIPSNEFFQMKYADPGYLNNPENIASPIQPNLGESTGIGGALGNGTAPPAQIKKADEAINFIRFNNLINRKIPETMEYLKSRGFNEDILRKYKIGIGYDSFFDEVGNLVEIPVVYFPMFMPKSRKEIELGKERGDHKSTEVNVSDWKTQLVRVKVRGVGKKLKRFQKLEPAPGFWGMFGLNTIPVDAKEIVITEGEFDAMAVNQATGLPAISLPNGASHIPLQVLPMLEKYQKIYLWMDSDEAGKMNAPKIAEKLGVNRTFIVNTQTGTEKGPKDANDALLEDPASLIGYIKKSKSINQENLLTFENLKEGILNRILKFEQNVGVKSTFLSFWNKKLKGFRRGEFTILTGITGSGKTTLLSQLALDFCKNGVPTLMGSFELKNEILATSMLMQLSYTNLVKEPHKFEFYASEFERLNMKFMNFFGSTNIDKILSTIEFAIYAYDIAHVIIDNLQFLLSGQGRGIEKFEIQDEAISKFRELATRLNVHVTLVIHPRKVDDDQDLNLSSIFGSAKVSQEADNVIILQSRRKYKILELKKNRFDGDLGAVALGFDRECKRYFELYQNEVVLLDKRQDTVEDVIAARRRDKKPDSADGDFFSYFDMQGQSADFKNPNEAKPNKEAPMQSKESRAEIIENVMDKTTEEIKSEKLLATENFLNKLKDEEREQQLTRELNVLRASDRKQSQKSILDHDEVELITEEILETYLNLGPGKVEKDKQEAKKTENLSPPSEFDSTVFNSHEIQQDQKASFDSSPYDLFLTKNKEKVDSFFTSKDKVLDETTKSRLLKTVSQGGMEFSGKNDFDSNTTFKNDEVFYDKMNIESHATRRKKPYFKKTSEDEN